MKILPAGALLWAWEADADFEEAAGEQWLTQCDFSHGADIKFLFSREGRMGAPRRLQPARGRGQPDRYANVDAPQKKQKLSRAEQRRCSAQRPPPHRMCCTPTRRQHHSEADIHRQTGRL